MRHAAIVRLAGSQFNRVSRTQLLGLGLSESAIGRLVARNVLVTVEEGVFAVAPIQADVWGRFMAATLTAAGSILSHLSAAVAWGLLSLPRRFESVTRLGNGGPRRHGGIVAYRKQIQADECTLLRGVPITSVARTLIDIAPKVSDRALARAVREAVRLGLITRTELGDALGRYRGRPGSRKLAAIVARYTGLPLERARSGAEVCALEILRESGYPMPRLNHRIAGEEADLSWASRRLIVEIDGGPFHLDVGEDARKQRIWEATGWQVSRISADEVYERPRRLLELAPAPIVPE